MANANPHQARAAKKRIAADKAGSTDELRVLVWKAIRAASEIVADADVDAGTRLRAVHGVTQSAGAYVKLVEATEFECRLRALEEARENEGEPL